jgi:peptide deformylase
MARLEVRIMGDPILERIAAPVEHVDDQVRAFLENMFETMTYERGIGLAAPQVGISQRIVVIEIGGKRHGMINPEIVEKRGKSQGIEACLSVPDLEGEVERADWIRLRYLDSQGESQELEADDILARCIQHELDHLDGVLFVTRVSPARRMVLRKKIKEMRRATRVRLGLVKSRR